MQRGAVLAMKRQPSRPPMRRETSHRRAVTSIATDHACDCDLQRGQNTRRYGTIGSSSGLATGHVAAPTRWRVLLVAVSPVQNHATVVGTTLGGLVVRHRVVLAEALHRHATA